MIFNILDVLFVNITNPKQNYQKLSKEFSAIEPPIWAGMLTKAISSIGWKADILDADVEELSTQDTAKRIRESYDAIRVVAFVVYGQQPSASTQNMPAALETFKYLRELNPKQHVIFLGLHPSALPEQTLLDMEEKSLGNNLVGKGEGIYTVHALLSGHKPENIPGLHYRKKSEYRFTPPPSIVKKLDKELPGIAWDKLPMDKYRAHNWHCNFGSLEDRSNYASIYTSLGCPFNCSFCCINAPFGKPGYRCWSIDHVINELDILAEKYNIKNIKFADELFVLNPNRVIELCDRMIERNYGFNIWAYARVDTCKPALLEKLKLAGINWLGLGIESGNIDIRKEMYKGKFQEKDIHKVAEHIKSYDISIGGNYIFGLPNDTMETMGQTLKLALELNCEMANFYCAAPYPGSDLHRKTKPRNLPEVRGNGWKSYSQLSYDFYPSPTDNLTSADVLKFRDEAFMEYYTDVHYLDAITKKFGQAAIEGIKKMTDIKIKRKLLNN